MTGLEVYAVIKFWLPLATAFGLVIQAWRSSKKGITEWADSLLHNHLYHIQTATESTATTLKEISAADIRVAATLAQVAANLKLHEIEEARTQAAILTGIEVLKAKAE